MYDRENVRALAAELESRVRAVEVTAMLIGALVGAGLSTPAMALTREDAFKIVALGLGALIGGLIGLSIGRSRSLALRIQMHQLLCQLQIEINTSRMLTEMKEAPDAAPVERSPPAVSAAPKQTPAERSPPAVSAAPKQAPAAPAAAATPAAPAGPRSLADRAPKPARSND